VVERATSGEVIVGRDARIIDCIMVISIY